MTDSTPLSDFRPVRSGLMTGALDDLASVGLAGSRCRACGETTLGANTLCPNCGSDDVFLIALSDEGKVWTYTVVRYRPPGDYKGAEPFKPFAIGLVELPRSEEHTSTLQSLLSSSSAGCCLKKKTNTKHVQARPLTK